MSKFIIRCSVLVFVYVALLTSMAAKVSAHGDAQHSQGRAFQFDYDVSFVPPEDSDAVLDIFVPLAADNAQQKLEGEEIRANIEGQVKVEAVYNNRYWHGRVKASDVDTVKINIRSQVRRFAAVASKASSARALDDAELEKYQLFLKANQRVVINDPVLLPIQKEIEAMHPGADKNVRARDIYDWVVSNVEYKKVGSGWGNGDTFWACNERYGNCTDFHSLFISLARSEQIPARFEMGFPVPQDKAAGNIGGYHCWVQFYLPGRGWVPIDASEAAKAPLKRDFYYGNHPQDRILFSVGRDLKLGAHTLNYFIYPHIELNGEIYKGEVKKTFSYRAK